jgi:hypothetical protein
MKNKVMKRALSALVAAARVRWLAANGKLHNIAKPWRSERTVRLANIAEGTHDGRITKGVDAAITERYLLGKIGSASDRVAVCGASDTPIGVITDEAAAIGDLVHRFIKTFTDNPLSVMMAGRWPENRNCPH